MTWSGWILPSESRRVAVSERLRSQAVMRLSSDLSSQELGEPTAKTWVLSLMTVQMALLTVKWSISRAKKYSLTGEEEGFLKKGSCIDAADAGTRAILASYFDLTNFPGRSHMRTATKFF